VVEVLPAVAEAQLAAGQQLIGGEAFRRMDNETLVVLEMEEASAIEDLPLGVSAQVAVYSDHMHHVAIMRKILLRMLSWQHYLYLDH
jgi:hypothetical protein